MAFIEGTDRFQSQFMDLFTFDNLISDDNYVRVIDAFVNSLNLKDLGFITYSGDRGQKPYHTETLLKIHIYCFFNGIQSSRKQERECTRNIELIWLTGNLKPDHSTLAAFTKSNSDALKNVFKQFSQLCRKLDLYDFKIFAIDGTKIKANCSKKRAFTVDSLTKALEHIDEKINEYLSKIDDDNSSIDDAKKAEFQKKLDLINERKIEYTALKKRMIDNNINELCLTDPDSKVMKNHSKLILDYDVTNQANDVGLLKPMVDKVVDDYNLNDYLEKNPEHTITNLADAGYYKISDLLALNSDRIKALCPEPSHPAKTGDMNFSKSAFTYNPDSDTYTCPNKQTLNFLRNSTETRRGVTNKYKIYSCNACTTCPYLDKCTKSVNGRMIKRNIEEDKITEINNEYKKDSSFYKLRKELVEHPFGTIKFNLGLSHVFVKGLNRVASWSASVFLAYNLKRVINIVGIPKLMEELSTN